MKIYCQVESNINKNNEYISCPFCKENDYDLIGLKSHLLNEDCKIFNDLPNIFRKFSK